MYDYDNQKSQFGSIQAGFNAKTSGKSYEVYSHIRELILHNELKPGQKISEEEIASMLHTSRTPVREALQRLSGDGLVTIFPRRHAEVTKFSEEMIHHIGYVRLTLDVMSAQLAIHYGSDADFQKLHKLADLCEDAFSAGDIYSAIISDRNFHLGITAITGNDILLNYGRATYLRLHLLQLQFSVLLQSHEKRNHFHQTLLNAFNKRDSIGVTAAIANRYKEVYGLEDKIIDFYTKTFI